MPAKKKSKKKEEHVDEIFDDSYNDDDVVFEGSEDTATKIKVLKEKLNACQAESKEHLLGWQRAKADFVNARKEYEEKLGRARAIARGDFVEELLPVIDSFDMAFANKEAWEEVGEGWRKGVEYIYSQFLSVLENSGVVQIDPMGQAFDPHLHISMEQATTNNKKEDGMVVAVIQKGYMMEDKTLRPARVKVARYEE